MLFKVLVVGEPSVGKTSLVKRYVDGVYNDRYRSTIGVAHSAKTLPFLDPEDKTKVIQVTLQFWDLAGQDRLNNMVKIYYRGAAGALCVCDILREETRQQMDQWRDNVHENSTRSDGSLAHPPCIALFNKMDLYGRGADRSWLSAKLPEDHQQPIQQVTVDGDAIVFAEGFYQAVADVAIDGGYDSGFPVSARLGVGIELAIFKLIDLMIRRHRQESKIEAEARKDVITLGNTVEDPDGVLREQGEGGPTLNEVRARAGNRCGC